MRIYRLQHETKNCSQERLRKGLLQTNEQLCVWKAMENIRKHRNIKLVNNEEEYLKNVMKPKFKSGALLGPDLMGCEMGKVRVVINKPVYLGKLY